MAPGGLSLEIILKDELQGMLDHFSAAFDIRIGVFDPFGRELACGLNRGSCAFCRWLRADLGLEGECQRTDKENFRKASKGSSLLVYNCHAGLVEAIQPLRLDDGELAGFFMIGQFRVEGEGPSQSLLSACGRDRERRAKIDKLYASTSVISKDRLPHVLALFSMIVSMAAERRMLTMKGDLLIARIERIALEGLNRPLPLSEAAKRVGRSPSTVSHLFKARLGVSFKQRILELKLDAAEKLLREIPGMTVSEAASSCGFSCPFHFSRLFKRHRGVSPSKLKSLGAGQSGLPPGDGSAKLP